MPPSKFLYSPLHAHFLPIMDSLSGLPDLLIALEDLFSSTAYFPGLDDLPVLVDLPVPDELSGGLRCVQYDLA